jgi:protein-tyrosine phosphatase
MPAVLLVCLGNICRSPMAEGILRHKLRARGAALVDGPGEGWWVDSAGTGGHHAGEDAHPRTRAVLARVGASFAHAARQVTRRDFDQFDLLLAMDGANHADLLRMAPAGEAHKVQRMLAWTTGGDVPDPWYGGPEDYDEVYALLDAAIDAWLERWDQAAPGAR